MGNMFGNHMSFDIKYSKSYPCNVLSNLYPNAFTIDGIECASMEGFLQALTHPDPIERAFIVTQYGTMAKSRSNPKWKERGLLHWNGHVYDRHEDEYQLLLDRAYSCLFQNKDFRHALSDTGDSLLEHTIGNHNPLYTILTEYEFCSRLMLLRCGL